ncbi:Integrin-alpha FG-GAP repeat-containing protein 1 [Intoshia linei]|uniref:Integrin-alpha FG-GAP repeat-containing protein 1 n=1 Tax=Intoshia linei TaxID=1819745 RepID=A0A177BEP6_9BILA|nr:Integrin-alpha FG-GAP repeat-containing protein 1 [Intoshia linei]
MNLLFLYFLFIKFSAVLSQVKKINSFNKLYENMDGIIMAYGDFNLDNMEDLVLYNPYNNTISIYTQNNDDNVNTVFEFYTKIELPHQEKVIGIIAIDLNTDFYLDIICTFKNENLNNFYVYMGNADNDFQINHTILDIHDEPFVFDYLAKYKLHLLLNKGNYSILWSEGLFIKRTDLVPSLRHSHGFADIYVMVIKFYLDLIFTTKAGFTVYSFKDEYTDEVFKGLYPPKCKNCKCDFSYVDTNSNSQIDIICGYIFNNENYISIFNFEDKTWSDQKIEVNINKERALFAKEGGIEVLRFADYNLDGFIDFLTVVETENKEMHVALFSNKLGYNLKKDVKRTDRAIFEHDAKYNLQNLDDLNIVRAAFIDSQEDGNLDVIVSYQNSENHLYKSVVYEFNRQPDGTFIHIKAFFTENDKHHSKMFPPVAPGVTITYSLQNLYDYQRGGKATQLSKTGHSTLSIKYTAFGLGPSPNFVDKIVVGLCRISNNYVKRERVQIIPNSKNIVIINPRMKPELWKFRLFLKTSSEFYYTAILFSVIFTIFGIVASMLYLLEKRQDKQDMLNRANVFHFDAM